MAVQNKDVYGVIASMLGVDALDAADQDLILSSSSPMLKIAFVKVITLTSLYGNTYTLFNHALGYPPFFMLYQVSGTTITHEFIFDTVECDKDNVTLSDSTSPFVGSDFVPQTRTFVLVVCRNPLNKAIKTPVFRTLSREAAIRNRNYGLITAKDGKSTDSKDMRDFTFHSDTRNLLVHAVDAHEILVDGGGQYIATWVNDLPYRPIFFGFVSLNTGVKYRMLYGGEQAAPGIRQNDNGDVVITSFTPSAGTKHHSSIWIFKDPFDIGATTTVTI